MIIEKLIIKNFKSINNAVIDMRRLPPGLHFLTGKNNLDPNIGNNGSGKSSVYDSLCWVLFDRTVSNEKGPDIVPWQETKKGTKVKLVCTIAGKKYIIIKTRKPNKLTVNKKITTQKDLEQLIKITKKEFLTSIIIGQKEPHFADLKPKARLQLLTDTLNLDFWQEASEKAKTLGDKAAIKVVSLQKDMEAVDDTIVSIKDRIKETKDLIDNLDNDYEKILKEVDKEIDTLIGSAKMFKGALKKLDKTIELWEDYDNSDKEKIKDLASKIDDLTRSINKEEREVVFIDREVLSLNKELALFQKLGTVCPHCRSQVSPKHRKAHIKAIDAKLSDLKDKQNSHKAKAKKLRKRCDKITAKRENLLDNFESQKEKINNVKEDRSYHRGLLRSTENDLERKKQHKIQLNNRIKNESTKLQNMLAKHKNALSTARERKYTIETNIRKLNKKGSQFAYWHKTFQKLRLAIIDGAVASLNTQIGENIEQLGITGWNVGVSVTKEKKTGGVMHGVHVFVKNTKAKSRETTPWESWSGGEAHRIRLAITMSFADLILERRGIESNVEVYDEPTTHISPEGISDLVDMLHNRAQRAKKIIWFVDQHTLEYGRFQSVWQATKNPKGRSAIEKVK